MRFGQGLIQSLINPSYGKGLFTAGAGMGQIAAGVPQQMREAQEQRQGMFNQAIDYQQQYQQAAQSGDARLATQSANQLLALAKKSGDSDMATKAMEQLKNVENIKKQGAIKGVLSIETALEREDLDPSARVALEQRKELLLQDPDVRQSYNKAQVDQWKFAAAKKAVEAEKWLSNNSSKIMEAVMNEDEDVLTNIITTEAGEYSSAAQKYAESVVQFKDTLAKLEDANPTVPQYDLLEEQINALPSSYQKQLSPKLKAYKAVIDNGWSDKNEGWKTEGHRARAESLYKDINNILTYNAIPQIAAGGARSELEDEVNKSTRIKELELKLSSPMDSSYLEKGRVQANALAERGDAVTQEDIVREANRLWLYDQNVWRQQLDLLTGTEQKETGDAETVEDIIEEAMLANPQGTRKQVINALKEQGFIPKDYVDATEDSTRVGAYDLSADIAQVERIRSKITDG